MARADLDALRDDLYVLACAVEDVQRDLAGNAQPSTKDLQDAIAELLEAARPLTDVAPGLP